MKTLNYVRCAATILMGGMVASANAVPVTFVYTDGANEGFNDPSLGAARKAAFENAVNIWAVQINGTVPVVVSASFDPLGGSPSGATLGAAAPTTAAGNFPNAPQMNTWYPVALANQLAGSDVAPSHTDIVCQYNSDVDNSTVLGNVNWYYGLDGNPGSHVDFRSTVLHEIGHGLGFVSLMDGNTGALASGFPDVFTARLAQSPSSNPSDGGRVNLTGAGVTDTQRFNAARSNQLYWTGSNVLAARGNSMVSMYAPATYEPGSSVSHWNTTNSPDLLMEPFDTGSKSNIDLTKQAFQDLGWTFVNSAVSDWSIY